MKIQFNHSPFRMIAGVYLGLTFLFALLYAMPFSAHTTLSFLECWFLSASAISVTGLSTINLAETLTPLGQWILLIEIQIGGVGIMAILGVLLMVFTQNVSLSQQTLMSFDQSQAGLKSVKKLVFFILSFTLMMETIGFLMVYPMISTVYPGNEGVFKSLFHSVASFTNAGFDLFGGSLHLFGSSSLFLWATSLLIFAGALGFPTVLEVVFSKGKKKSVYTKVNITGHLSLILIGFFFFLFSEWHHTLASWNTVDKASNALFLSITSRSGGLTSLPMESITSGTLLFLLVLMFIGGSTSSSAGGIRISTFVVLIAKLRSVIKGQEQVVLFKKGVHEEDVNKSFLVFFVFFGLFVGSVLLLSFVENVSLASLCFEVMSALTTTGLSIGITEELSTFSLMWLSMLMIIGRIGMIALIYSLIRPKKANTSYVKEHVIVG